LLPHGRLEAKRILLLFVSFGGCRFAVVEIVLLSRRADSKLIVWELLRPVFGLMMYLAVEEGGGLEGQIEDPLFVIVSH
jgi:hypothetical protein